MEFETFVADVIDQSSSMRVTIPSNLVKYMGIVAGDTVKIMVKKVYKNDINGL